MHASPLFPAHPRPARPHAQRGFALLITVTLLAFLVILLIGLASFTRVETSVAGNTQRQAQARENALMALDVAVAHLQKYAGQDQVVTATAESFGPINNKRLYTGVWDAKNVTVDPLTWLVSGNERLAADGTANPLAVTQSTPLAAANAVQLVGPQSAGTGNTTAFVSVPLQPITTVGVPATTGATVTTIGRYAWWVGDQGVKAPVGTGDDSSTVTYAPFDGTELRNRIRQQVALGAGAADATGTVVFEPRSTANATLTNLAKVTATNQLALLKNPAGTAIGIAAVQKNFHAWSANNYAVLANTKTGGLRQDLSLQPTLLGAAYAKWADYTDATYMEDWNNPATPVPSPAYDLTNPIRRRYFMQPRTTDGGAVLSVAPVLSYALFSFSVRVPGAGSKLTPLPVQLCTRWMISFWNPYSSALVPEDLRLDVTGLPNLTFSDDTTKTSLASIPMQAVLGGAQAGPASISLPWNPSGSLNDDRQSWLPGRVYSWTAKSADLTSSSGPPDGGYVSNFYSTNMVSDAPNGVQQTVGTASALNTDLCHIDGSAPLPALQFTLVAVRGGQNVELAKFTAPPFGAFSTTPAAVSKDYQFSYVFRLGESADGALWLTTAGLDFHSGVLDQNAFVTAHPLPDGASPEKYGVNYAPEANAGLLLDRATNSTSYDEDVPVFELPRAPLLSLGMLQHLALDGQRPFAIGNSWGMSATLNGITVSGLYDQYFYSGLLPSITPTLSGGVPLLPNTALKVIPRNSASPTGDNVALTDLQNAPNAQSSKYLLQGSAFNINSVNPIAWAAVLRGVRFPAPQSFAYLNDSFGSGTGSDTSKLTVQSNDAQFFRFAQSAHETYEADDPVDGVTYAASTVAPPDAPSPASAANTQLFRRGMKTLTTSQVTALANAITAAIGVHQAASGPYPSLEQFLAPDSSGSSLLEQAIASANINVDANGNTIEFSSQFLTQADILNALAPVLFPRSDTFVVRTYGEALNALTGATEGRAWCEAIVQRVPDYVDPVNDAAEIPPGALVSPLNQAGGRRFKIVSFRWLTRSDI